MEVEFREHIEGDGATTRLEAERGLIDEESLNAGNNEGLNGNNTDGATIGYGREERQEEGRQ